MAPRSRPLYFRLCLQCEAVIEHAYTAEREEIGTTLNTIARPPRTRGESRRLEDVNFGEVPGPGFRSQSLAATCTSQLHGTSASDPEGLKGNADVDNQRWSSNSTVLSILAMRFQPTAQEIVEADEHLPHTASDLNDPSLQQPASEWGQRQLAALRVCSVDNLAVERLLGDDLSGVKESPGALCQSPDMARP